MEPMTSLEDPEYLSDAQSDSEFSSSSQYFTLMFTNLLFDYCPSQFSQYLILNILYLGGIFGFSSLGSPESGSGESDPEFSYPMISSE